ncbi:MAG: ATP-binding protein, partial [Myxococcota bacterium]
AETAELPFGCGECRSCRRVLQGAHPDLQWLMPEAEAVGRGLVEADGKRQPSREIRVPQVRDLTRAMRMKPYEGRARVAIVLEAHRMNVNAANALLKTLEEPGEHSLLVLTAPHERAVLPTIASRCQRITFSPLPEAIVRAVLERLGLVDAAARAALANGSVADALRLDPKLVEENADDFPLLKVLAGGSTGARLDAAEALGKDRGEVDRALVHAQRQLAKDLRDFVAAAPADAEAVAERRHRAQLLTALEEARGALRNNAQVQLTLESLLLAANRRPRSRSSRP